MDTGQLGVLLWTIAMLSSSTSLAVYGLREVSSSTPSPSALKQNGFLEWILSLIQNKPATAKPETTTPPTQCPACTCGTANTVKRIVGGYETGVNQYPWMAMLLFRGRFYCGGSLISELYVVSAGHCIKGFPKNLLGVRLMAHSLKHRTTQVIERTVAEVMVHEKYSTRNYDNDISLLKLDKKVEMSDVLRPVCMPVAGNTYEGDEAIIIGWGATSEGGVLAQNLTEVKVPILSQMACRQTKYGPERITDNMLCAGVTEGGLDACQGDSGGPLHIKRDDLNTYHLAGVVSWGEGCARKDYPGVYSRVTQYLDWISENTGDSCKCDMPEKKVTQVEILLEE